MTTNEVRMYIKVYICGLTKSVCIKKKKRRNKKEKENQSIHLSANTLSS